MTVRKFGRRSLLLGGAAAVSLPWLPSLGRTQAAGNRAKRLVFVMTSNGVSGDDWFPETGRDFVFPYSTEPFQSYRDRLMVVQGVENSSAREQSGNPHSKAGSHTLTGAPHIPNQFANGGDSGFATSISIDQHIAGELATPGSVASLITGVETDAGTNGVTARQNFSYAGRNMPVATEENAQRIFARLVPFTGTGTSDDGGAAARLVAERRSVLDSALSDIQSLQRRLSAADRRRLDGHLTQLRAIETRLVSVPMGPQQCATPEEPDSVNGLRNKGRLLMDLMAFAFRCNITPVATFQWGSSQDAIRYTPIIDGLPDLTHHNLSHKNGGEYDRVMREVARFHAEETAYMLDTLDSFDEDDGTVLDNTLVVHMNTLNRGNTHNFRDLPIIIAGGTRVLDVGRSVNVGSRSLNDLHITLANLMGVEMTTFGSEEFVEGPIEALRR